MKTIAADDQRFNALQAGEINVMTVVGDKYVDRARGAGMISSSPSSSAETACA